MIVLLLIALVASQVLSFWFFFDERKLAVRTAARDHVLSRTASIVRLLAEVPPRLYRQVLKTASTPRLIFWISETANARKHGDNRTFLLAERLRAELNRNNANVVVELKENDDHFFTNQARRWRHHDHDEHQIKRRRRHSDSLSDDDSLSNKKTRGSHRKGRHVGISISVQLSDARWLNAETKFRMPPLTWALPTFAAMAAMALALIVIVIVMVRRLTGPMGRLATAADELGRGEAVGPLREEGPKDIRLTMRAFDKMRDRLQRFVQDRTRMLAAISHDLRTPLTALRLRAEFIADPETKERMLATIQEMSAMVEATLAFAHEEALQEDTRTVDLNALVESVCVDFSDLGNDVTFEPGDHATYACRPLGLKRALRNVVENAIRYAGAAHVEIKQTETNYLITVKDEGPGLPESELERVFEPFIRLDPSRNQDAGGIGLGLSIVRSIIRGHGGDVSLENRQNNGLRVSIKLPKN